MTKKNDQAVELRQKFAQEDFGLTVEKQNELADRFNPFMETVNGLIATAATIKVESVADFEAMQLARTTRLSLKAVRVDVEKTRKDLKEASMREGKAIDGMANIIKYLIVPAEKQLQDHEDFVKKIEQERIDKIVADRTDTLSALGVDCSCFDLANMKGAAFESLRESSVIAYDKRQEEKRKEEQAAADAARKEKEDHERMRIENAKLKAEQEAAAAREAEAEKKREEERAAAESKLKAEQEARQAAERKVEEAREKAEAAERKRQSDDRRREQEEKQRKRDEELAAIKQDKEDEQRRKAAPDKVKMSALSDAICALDVPTVSSEAALAAMHEVRGTLNRAVKILRGAVRAIEEQQAEQQKPTTKGKTKCSS